MPVTHSVTHFVALVSLAAGLARIAAVGAAVVLALVVVYRAFNG